MSEVAAKTPVSPMKLNEVEQKEISEMHAKFMHLKMELADIELQRVDYDRQRTEKIVACEQQAVLLRDRIKAAAQARGATESQACNLDLATMQLTLQSLT